MCAVHVWMYVVTLMWALSEYEELGRGFRYSGFPYYPSPQSQSSVLPVHGTPNHLNLCLSAIAWISRISYSSAAQFSDNWLKFWIHSRMCHRKREAAAGWRKTDTWMASVCWPYFDPEYENLSIRINPPRLYFFANSLRLSYPMSFAFGK